MITASEWELIRDGRVDAALAALLALPKPYQEWVTRKAQNRGCPTLRRGVLLGPGEVTTYDALIAVCEREIARKPTTKTDRPAGGAS